MAACAHPSDLLPCRLLHPDPLRCHAERAVREHIGLLPLMVRAEFVLLTLHPAQAPHMYSPVMVFVQCRTSVHPHAWCLCPIAPRVASSHELPHFLYAHHPAPTPPQVPAVQKQHAARKAARTRRRRGALAWACTSFPSIPAENNPTSGVRAGYRDLSRGTTPPPSGSILLMVVILMGGLREARRDGGCVLGSHAVFRSAPWVVALTTVTLRRSARKPPDSLPPLTSAGTKN